MLPVTPFQLGYWGTRYLISKYVRNRVSKRVQGTIIAGLAGSYLVNKKKSVKMMTPSTAPRKRAREGASSVLPDMGTFTNNPVSSSEDVGGYIQKTKERAVVGRPLNPLSRLNKLLSCNINSNIDRYQRITTQIAGGTRTGAYYLYNDRSGGPPLSKTMPVHLFDLTALRNNHGYARAGALPHKRYGIPFHTLTQVAGSSQTYQWNFLEQTAPDWVNSSLPSNDLYYLTNRWIEEEVPFTSESKTDPYSKAYLDWAHIKLDISGAVRVPSDVIVRLVRLHPDVQPPMHEVDDQNLIVDRANNSNETIANSNKFWDKFTAPLIGNDIANAGAIIDTSKFMDVIWQRKYSFNPTLTVESDASGHEKVLDLFYNMDMVVEYTRQDINDETASGGSGIDPGNLMFTNNPNWFSRVRRSVNGSCYPKNPASRVFLMITSTNPYDNQSESFYNNDYASYDLLIRRKVSYLEKN